MPTTRSLFTFGQFKQVFQKMAHEIAIEAVTDLVTGGEGLLVKGYSSGELSEVNAGAYHIKFYANHLGFSYGQYSHPDHMDFEIEEKFYSTSAHCTKMSFFSPEYKKTEGPKVKDGWGYEEFPVDHKRTDAEKKRRQNKIDEFLEKLMKDADLKPEPRFSLQKYSKH